MTKTNRSIRALSMGALVLVGALGFLGMTRSARAEDRFLPSPVISVAEATREARTSAMHSWERSLLPLVASQALDSASSYGMREVNPVLAGPDGSFGMKSVALKAGVTAALMGVEYLITRRSPRAARLLAKLNWTGAAVTTGLAVHNYAIR